MSNRQPMTKISSESENEMNTNNAQPAISSKPAIASIFVQTTAEVWNIKDASFLLQGVLKKALHLDSGSLIAELSRLQFDPQVESTSETGDLLTLWINDPNLGRVRLECHLRQVRVH